jgi:Uma2 family endonuclease
MRSEPSPPEKLTYADFLLFPDDGKRHELIDGEHYVTPSPNLRHQTISGRLHHLISIYLDDRPIGEVWAAPLDTVLSNFDVVEPDLIYVSRERSSILTTQNIRGAPDLVIEILSPGTLRRDEGIKRRAYERFGISEYWIVDPDLNRVSVYRLDGERFELIGQSSSEQNDTLQTPLMPGLAISVRDLFR